ncbi:MAG: hypothetical protein AB1640_00170 [bacterium]
MSRRDQWKQAADKMIGEVTKAKTFEEQERVPDRPCGVCQGFSESAYTSGGGGTCKFLKMGSDISVDPPVYVNEGEAGLIVFFNTDGSKCRHFSRMEMIDRDGTECADPVFRRMQRQMEKVGK